jgi:hypothetical protein
MSGPASGGRVAEVSPTGRRRGRVVSVIAAVWGAVTGLAPHVLHHVGPLAGAALLAGAAGTVLFGVVGLVAAIPFLLRLRRRFDTWAAPGIAVVVFVVMFTLSTVVIGPRFTADEASPPGVTEAEHLEHHP